MPTKVAKQSFEYHSNPLEMALVQLVLQNAGWSRNGITAAYGHCAFVMRRRIPGRPHC
jgi:hypothetical protein